SNSSESDSSQLDSSRPDKHINEDYTSLAEQIKNMKECININLSDFDSDHDQYVSQASSSKFVRYRPTLTSKASFSKVIRSDASLISKVSSKNQHQKEPITLIIINSDDDRSDNDRINKNERRNIRRPDNKIRESKKHYRSQSKTFTTIDSSSESSIDSPNSVPAFRQKAAKYLCMNKMP
ncbi:17805_t:CDS:2, partial [Funneliformis caledonium]